MFITKTGLSLYFASNRPGTFGGLDIYVSQRASVDDPWGPPQNLRATINSAFGDHCAMVSPDGHYLLFLSDRPGGLGANDFWISYRSHTHDDFGWEAPQHVNGPINSAFDEYGPTFFEDDETGAGTLFFNSNRPGGQGGYDIWSVSVSDDFTSFGMPTPVTELNTTFNDDFPSVRHNGLEIFFRSNRPGGQGGFDLWTSTRASTSSPWSTPVNLGPVVNSSVNEQRPAISWDGLSLIFGSRRPGGAGDLDLWVTTREKVRGRD